MLDSLKSGSKAVGVKQSVKAIEGGRVKTVYIAKDADEKVVSNIKELCKMKSIEVIYVDNMKMLGKACGIDVGAAVACLVK
ncbi:MAG: ribosomal L7Ae/L30e/S12e/Gadd45 family protein [Clostridia bacterium]|nr:ribosomal L7Ae/L30e/S12e/Gadd45 family protein [Clostridia bacterium]